MHMNVAQAWRVGSPVFWCTAVVLAALLPAHLAAQTCMGTAPFSAGIVRAGVMAARSPDASSVGAALSAGMEHGLFANTSISRLSIEVARRAAPAFAATAGYGIDIELPPDHLWIQACPFVGAEYVDGPQVDLGPGIPRVDVTSRAYRAGLALGESIHSHDRFSLVPNAAFSYVLETAVTRQGGATENISEDYGLLEFGMGVVIDRIFTLQAGLAIPIWLDRAASALVVGVGMNFGGGGADR